MTRLTPAQLGLLCDIGQDGPASQQGRTIISGSGLRFMFGTAIGLQKLGLVTLQNGQVHLTHSGIGRYEAWKTRKRRALGIK